MFYHWKDILSKHSCSKWCNSHSGELQVERDTDASERKTLREPCNSEISDLPMVLYPTNKGHCFHEVNIIIICSSKSIFYLLFYSIIHNHSQSQLSPIHNRECAFRFELFTLPSVPSSCSLFCSALGAMK